MENHALQAWGIVLFLAGVTVLTAGLALGGAGLILVLVGAGVLIFSCVLFNKAKSGLAQQ